MAPKWSKKRGGAEKCSTFMYIILGRGRKSGVARATGATASLAPLHVRLRFEMKI